MAVLVEIRCGGSHRWSHYARIHRAPPESTGHGPSPLDPGRGGSDVWPDLAEVAHDVPFAQFTCALFASVFAQASLLSASCLQATGFGGGCWAPSPPDQLHPGAQGPAAWIGEWECGGHNSSSWFSGRGYLKMGRRYPEMTIR